MRNVCLSVRVLRLFACLLTLFVPLTFGGFTPAQTLPQANAHVGFLDKITGRFQDKVVSTSADTVFGTLLVKVHACYRSAPGEKNESIAFFEITDIRDNTATKIFSGWMFATTPSLSSVEHAVYDIWLIACPKDKDLLSTSFLLFPDA